MHSDIAAKLTRIVDPLIRSTYFKRWYVVVLYWIDRFLAGIVATLAGFGVTLQFDEVRNKVLSAGFPVEFKVALVVLFALYVVFKTILTITDIPKRAVLARSCARQFGVFNEELETICDNDEPRAALSEMLVSVSSQKNKLKMEDAFREEFSAAQLTEIRQRTQQRVAELVTNYSARWRPAPAVQRAAIVPAGQPPVNPPNPAI
jgi:hypothetical protein